MPSKKARREKRGSEEPVWEPWVFVRARLQPCRNWLKINKALAAEGFIPATLAYYTGKLGFACLGTWQDPPVYAIVARDQQVIHLRCAAPPTANPDNTRTNCATRTSSSKMPTHSMPSTPPRA